MNQKATQYEALDFILDNVYVAAEWNAHKEIKRAENIVKKSFKEGETYKDVINIIISKNVYDLKDITCSDTYAEYLEFAKAHRSLILTRKEFNLLKKTFGGIDFKK